MTAFLNARQIYQNVNDLKVINFVQHLIFKSVMLTFFMTRNIKFLVSFC